VVAHLVRLKLTLLRNSLKRGVAALVGMAFGVIYGGGFLLLGLAGLVSLRVHSDLELAASVVVLGGAGLVAAWALLPVLLFGVDPTLDPVRFATFSVRERPLAVGLVLGGLVGLPGVATLLLSLGMVVATSRSLGAVAVGVVAGACGLFTCVLLSRIVTAAAAAVLATRRGRDVAGIGGLALVLLLGPLLSISSGREVNATVVAEWAHVVGWTPLGWSWAAMADASRGDWGPALARLVLAGGLLLGLFALWERQLVVALRSPRPASGDGGSRSGLGLFGRLPATPMGAIAARAGTYWVRDPRFNVPAIMTILLPGGLLFVGIGGSHLALVAMPVASAYLIGWGQHNDVGYDSTAFWMHVSSGVDGVSDRIGRLFPSFLIATVCVPVYALLGPVFGSPWRLLPASLGVATAVALNGFAVSSVVSAVKQYAVPTPGENPFSSRPGSVGVTLAVQSLCGGAVILLSLPALVLGALAWFGWQWAAWTVLLVGPALGATALVIGVRAGADLFRRRQADLLQDLVAMR
jgi:ABC-2 type transport system permease protein